MQIIIANEVDDSFWTRREGRAWSQRALWFAKPGDLVILPCPPDTAFHRQVKRVTGREGNLEILEAPPGRYEGKVLDPAALMEPDFLAKVKQLCVGKQVEFVTLFPSARLLPFFVAIAPDALPDDVDFLRDGGANFVNSKAFFHILARKLGVKTPDSAVAFSQEEAVLHATQLLAGHQAIVVKRAHAGGGVGNELVAGTTIDADTLGVPWRRVVEDRGSTIEQYFDERWTWATNDNRQPVVLEEFIPASGCGYVEFYVTSSKPTLKGFGTLTYERSRIVRETVGALPEDIEDNSVVLDTAQRIAGELRELGYRGNACFDFITTPAGHFYFTECNARTTSGSHLYGMRAELHMVDEPLLQHSASAGWTWLPTEAILEAIARLGLEYDRDSGRGVFMVIPAAPVAPIGGFLYASVGVDEPRLTMLRDEIGKLSRKLAQEADIN